MGRHENPFTFGQDGQLQAGPFRQAFELILKCLRIRLKVRAAIRVHCNECISKLKRDGLNIRDAMPPMGICRIVRMAVVVMIFFRASDRFHRRSRHNECDSTFLHTGAKLVQIRLKSQPARQYNLHTRYLFDVARRGFVKVWVAPGLNDLEYLHPIAPDIPSDIGQHRAKRSHLDRLRRDLRRKTNENQN